ncbi:MAG: hypothetical protein ACREIA_23230 [Opitutaceae bacterium]
MRLLLTVLCLLSSALYAGAAPQRHAIFDAQGNFSRIEQLDTAKLPPIPNATDGLPRAIPLGSEPDYDPDTQTLQVQRDGTLEVVDLPAAEITRRAELKAKLAAREIKISQARAVKEKLEAGAALSAGELQAVVRILALEWIEHNVPEEESESESAAVSKP